MIVKNEEELKILREGGKKLAKILKQLEEFIRPGVSSQDIEDLARELIKKEEAEPATLGYKPKFAPKAYPAATCVSVNEVIVHGVPNENPRVLQNGDLVSVDVVIKYKGLFVDAAFTTGVGEIPKEAKSLMQANRQARDEAIKLAKAGTRVGEIGAFLDKFAKEHGYSLPKELGGHGVGRKIHERPFIGNYDGAPDSDYILKEGEVITIEPMMADTKVAKLKLLDDQFSYVVPGSKYTAHFEHSLIVWNNGPEVLTELE